MFRVPPALATAGIQGLESASGIAGRLRDGLTQSLPFQVAQGLIAMTSPDLTHGAERLLGAADAFRREILRSSSYRSLYFSQFPDLFGDPAGERLLEIALQPASKGRDGFPKISQAAFASFRDGIPHLFADGGKRLLWIDALEAGLAARPGLDRETRESLALSLEAFRTMIFTAAVTAPPDLWLQRQILATHAHTDVLDLLQRGDTLSADDAALLDLDANQLVFDLQFLEARGILEKDGPGFRRARGLPYRLDDTLRLPPEFRTDIAGILTAGFSQSVLPEEDLLIRRWLELPAAASTRNPSAAWVASRREMEVGYRLVPVVLALRASGLLSGLRAGSEFPRTPWSESVRRILNEAGFLSGSRVTALGARAFERGPGVYGIIGAYHPYLKHHQALLQEKGRSPWVERGKNIAASRDANRKSFKDAVEILWDYAQATGVRYEHVLEHAMGLAVGIQEFRKKFGDRNVRFFGADFEQAALDGARGEQAAGRLPASMKFVQSDIGRPASLIEFLRSEEALGRGTVMIVGNGFHEARGKTDEEMIATLRQYREAGITIVFTEESGLTGRQIREAAWNSYHAGFRWTHQISGQGLRSPWPMDPPGDRLSWTEVFEKAGYRVPKEFRRGTRAVFPCELPEDRNPAISVTFLCVP